MESEKQMLNEITVTVNGRAVTARANTLLSDILVGEKPCGGHGLCGKCKVMAKGSLSLPSQAEVDLLSANELDGGVRLACKTYALGDCEVNTLVPSKGEQIVTAGVLPRTDLKPCFSKYGVAVDIGTTTLAARLYNPRGETLAEDTHINPQQPWGADVVSRIEAALGGKDKELAIAIREAVNDCISHLADLAHIHAHEIDGVTVTGNTTMLSFLTEEDVSPLSCAPFEVKRLFGEVLPAAELGLSSLEPSTPIYLPPCISAFVGADAVCSMLATPLCEGDTAMLADIGTNGEMALWHHNKLTVCSTAAGPAFEGVGISMGMRGADGAIDKVSLVNGGLVAHVIGNTEPIGICGSGLVDAVACLLDLELVDESGYLEDGEAVVHSPVVLTQQDIRMLQLAKSAICAGLVTLMESENLAASNVNTLYIAGGFGNYLNKNNAVKIGLLPKKLAHRSETVGNAALTGASMLLLDSDLRQKAQILAASATTIELSSDPIFAERYISGMMLGEM